MIVGSKQRCNTVQNTTKRLHTTENMRFVLKIKTRIAGGTNSIEQYQNFLIIRQNFGKEKKSIKNKLHVNFVFNSINFMNIHFHEVTFDTHFQN